MRISIVGSGYVGLVSGACFAEMGHRVVCVDTDGEKVAKIRQGVSPFYEPGLDALLSRNAGDRLTATTDMAGAVAESDLTLIAVGTPFDGGAIDLAYVRGAAEGVGRALCRKATYHAVVVKSTVVPGTTDGVVRPILEAVSGKRAGGDFGLGVNPEFLTEGEAVADFMTPDRLVLGGMDTRTLDMLDELYAAFPKVDRVRTSNRTAEMIKYASNALLATAISFANEIANLTSALGGMDVADVLRAVHLSKYLSPSVAGVRVKAPIASFLWAGCGFGGSCLPKDVQALIAHGARAGVRMELLEAVTRINERQPGQLLARLQAHFPTLTDLPVAVLGLAFRPDTSDMRLSPASPIVRALIAGGARVRGYDPAANGEAAQVFARDAIRLCNSLEEAIDDVAAIVLVTRWAEFSRLPGLLAGRDPQPLVVDGRRMLDRAAIARYDGIGLGAEEPPR